MRQEKGSSMLGVLGWREVARARAREKGGRRRARLV